MLSAELFCHVWSQIKRCIPTAPNVKNTSYEAPPHAINRTVHPVVPHSDRVVIIAPTPPSELELSALFVRKSDVGVDGSTKLYDIPKGNCPPLIVFYYCLIVPNGLLRVKGCIKAYRRWYVKGLVADGIDFFTSRCPTQRNKSRKPFSSEILHIMDWYWPTETVGGGIRLCWWLFFPTLLSAGSPWCCRVKWGQLWVLSLKRPLLP